jgi:hypothetical protein
LQFLTTIGRRLDPALYVALWYVMAGSSLLVVLNSLRLKRLPGPSYPSALQLSAAARPETELQPAEQAQRSRQRLEIPHTWGDISPRPET